MNSRFDEMNKRFDMLMWMIGLFCFYCIGNIGICSEDAVADEQEASSVEATIEVQRDEISFKSMIEKLITSKVT